MKLRTIWSKGKTRSVHVMTRVYVRYHVTGAIICGVAMMSMSNQPAMSHHDNHGHNCGEHAHGDDHDHAHDHTSNSGPSDNLFAHIDRDNVVALNSVHGGSEVIKPWDERMDEQVVSTVLPTISRKACVASFDAYIVHRVRRGRSTVGTGASYSLIGDERSLMNDTETASSASPSPDP